MFSKSLDAFARRLRGLTFTHAVAECIGCCHSPGGIAKWWQHHHPRCPWNKRSQLERLRAGATIDKAVLADLCSLSPELADLYESQLWTAVAQLPSARACDELLDTVKVGSKRLDSDIGKFSKLLVDRVDLACLPINLALMFSGHSSYGLYRALLRKNFACMYAWYSAQFPFCYASRPLYSQIQLYMHGVGKPLPQNWSSWHLFRDLYFDQLEEVDRLGWLNGDGGAGALLLWNLPIKEHACFESCLDQSMEAQLLPMPKAAEKHWRCVRTFWVDNPVSLNGKECRLPGAVIGDNPPLAPALSHVEVVSPTDPVEDVWFREGPERSDCSWPI
ncbi:hypothetical protein [Pseudomonas sp. NPDC089734]|uniref:hypothetical protein n=1 Tax=Pseudomonas sp. NPDC089734 TaxID=3364469 RepID=UPI003806AE90